MSSLVVVALPREDDYVQEISSEKIPHMTLLYLGEAGTAENLDQIIDFVEHASKGIEPFWMEVDRRGLLGDDDADVLFFKKKEHYCNKVAEYRKNLLKNSAIKAAYLSADQYPDWIPHLTLGYPETPANELKEGRRLWSVEFDRIAVWDGDFKGHEFPLNYRESPREILMSQVKAHETALSHYGVKGMRWGVRNRVDRAIGGSPTAQRVAHLPEARIASKQARREGKFPTEEAEYRVQVTRKGQRKIETRGGRGHEPAPEAVKAHLLNQQRKASGLHTLSNQDLQALATRLNLERNVSQLTQAPASQSKAQKFIKTMLLDEKTRDKNLSNYSDLDAVFGGKMPLPGAGVATKIVTNKAARKKKN